MKTILIPLLATIASLLRSRAVLHLEILALRQQLAMVTAKEHKRLRFSLYERLFWVWFYRLWPGCLETLAVFKADTLVRWHRKAFRLYCGAISRGEAVVGGRRSPQRPETSFAGSLRRIPCGAHLACMENFRCSASMSAKPPLPST